MWQVFSPAKVIFAGVGVLLLVSILLDTLKPANLSSSGGEGSQVKPRYSYRYLRENRELFPTP